MDWEKEAARQGARADQLQEERDLCLAEIKKYREICQNVKYQMFVADSLARPEDENDQYRYTYP